VVGTLTRPDRRRRARALALVVWALLAIAVSGCGDNEPPLPSLPPPPGCGNGVQEVGEPCDDGNLADGDGCDGNCTITACGNGIATASEACDDGNRVNGDGCDVNCTLSGCGNGVSGGSERCDDGNLVDGDGCDSNCKVTGCGNGVATAGEACDDGNLVDGDGCDSNCTISACGNGALAPDEACDDGNLVDGDGCDSNCTMTRCGNAIETANEVCDDGNVIDGDGCDSNCLPTECGNGIATTGEACDDGNVIDGDGCDNNCTPTECGNGIATTGEACDDGNLADGDGCDSNCMATSCGNGVATAGEACDDGNLMNGDGCDTDCTVSLLAYVKASNTGEWDFFGHIVALSADGSTLAVGAPDEDSAATGINGDQADNSAPSAGAVYVFVRNGTMWVPQAYLKASNSGVDDYFGASLALSADGSVLAVGAFGEDSAATGVGGNQADKSAPSAGAAYVFTRSGTTWSQQAYVKASNTGANDGYNDGFGYSVALSSDGTTLAVGAPGEDSAATGIDGNQADNSTQNSGAVYVFTRSGSTWSQQAYVKASNTDDGDGLGVRVALSSDGSTLAVTARRESSTASGIDGNQADNSAPIAGAVFVFARSGATWSQQAYVKASNTGEYDYFGESVALSADGSTLAVGAPNEDSAAIGIDGNQADNSTADAGAVYVFARSGTAWSQQAYVKASNTDAYPNGGGDQFGSSVALSADGSTLAVGAPYEDSAATGVGGSQADGSVNSGAVYVLARSGATWSQRAYVKASNTDEYDHFGSSVALSVDGLTLAVGAALEGSAATHVDGNQADNSATYAGAVYVLY
jgi:trimeric autotransporter adhesin